MSQDLKMHARTPKLELASDLVYIAPSSERGTRIYDQIELALCLGVYNGARNTNL